MPCHQRRPSFILAITNIAQGGNDIKRRQPFITSSANLPAQYFDIAQPRIIIKCRSIRLFDFCGSFSFDQRPNALLGSRLQLLKLLYNLAFKCVHKIYLAR